LNYDLFITQYGSLNIIYAPEIPLASPESKGDFEKNPVPPFLRGARGDRGLTIKQQSVAGFDVRLTPRLINQPSYARISVTSFAFGSQ
jgi:hypothetical protein